jgi:hypothetical protein
MFILDIFDIQSLLEFLFIFYVVLLCGTDGLTLLVKNFLVEHDFFVEFFLFRKLPVSLLIFEFWVNSFFPFLGLARFWSPESPWTPSQAWSTSSGCCLIAAAALGISFKAQ